DLAARPGRQAPALQAPPAAPPSARRDRLGDRPAVSAPPGSEPLAAAGNLVGLVLATAATRLGRDATAVLSRLAGSLGDAARRAATELAALDEAARKRRRAELAAQVRTPTVATARGVHPTWIEASLVELPAR